MLKITRKIFLHLGIFLLIPRYEIESEASQSEDESPKEFAQRVEVRAVFINCQYDDDTSPTDSELLRFQRQELFKHNSLRKCAKKLALTIRMTAHPERDLASAEDPNNPKSQNDDISGDEYIPVDHVFEGSNKKRVRLLNPYILRLRRQSPVQAYKLKRIDTISGILTNPKKENAHNDKKKRDRDQRDLSAADAWSESAEFTLEHERPRDSYSVRVGTLTDLLPQQLILAEPSSKPISKDCGLRLFDVTAPNDISQNQIFKGFEQINNIPTHNGKGKHLLEKRMCSRKNQSWIRDKRHKQKYIPENDLGVDYRHGKIKSKDHYHERSDKSPRRDHISLDDDIDVDYQKPIRTRDPQEADETDRESEPYLKNSNSRGTTEDLFENQYRTLKDVGVDNNTHEKSESKTSSRQYEGSMNARHFALYEIGSPNLWYSVQVHLFEKMSTLEGKTVWNDMTNGEPASVSSLKPEWGGRDMTVRYRPAEWVARDDFSLSDTALCLLEPIAVSHNDSVDNEDRTTRNASNYNEYIIVPMEDIVGLDRKNTFKRHDNNSEYYESDHSSSTRQENPQRVEIRVSRALFGGNNERFGIAAEGLDRFLTLPHQKPHRVQIDLEVRADDNQLVRVGSSAAISQVVADTTRLKRTVLSIQATNTGLAAARFRAMARDCGPELSGLINEAGEGTMTVPMLLPPQHTRRMTLELPVEIPGDVVHCYVALLNDEDESVAVRDVAIRKGDRCFCIWHCNCVCLGEDPKLLCREMSPSHQLAAGLTPPPRPRLARSCCYVDCLTVNLCAVMTGVILLLLVFGFVKAILGMIFSSIGSWGLSMLLRMSRKLDRYYENSLRCRVVVYDSEGWPIHPDTGKRVQVVSKPMEFVLNVIFFVALPCILLFDAIKRFCGKCGKTNKGSKKTSRVDAKKCFSSQDMQNMDLRLRRKRRGELRRWMTPHAEELSTDLWQKALTPMRNTMPLKSCVMHPLLVRGKESQSADSEQDDTEYVLTQMQKSRESLAKSQKKATDS